MNNGTNVEPCLTTENSRPPLRTNLDKCKPREQNNWEIWNKDTLWNFLVRHKIVNWNAKFLTNEIYLVDSSCTKGWYSLGHWMEAYWLHFCRKGPRSFCQLHLALNSFKLKWQLQSCRVKHTVVLLKTGSTSCIQELIWYFSQLRRLYTSDFYN